MNMRGPNPVPIVKMCTHDRREVLENAPNERSRYAYFGNSAKHKNRILLTA